MKKDSKGLQILLLHLLGDLIEGFGSISFSSAMNNDYIYEQGHSLLNFCVVIHLYDIYTNCDNGLGVISSLLRKKSHEKEDVFLIFRRPSMTFRVIMSFCIVGNFGVSIIKAVDDLRVSSISAIAYPNTNLVITRCLFSCNYAHHAVIFFNFRLSLITINENLPRRDLVGEEDAIGVVQVKAVFFYSGKLYDYSWAVKVNPFSVVLDDLIFYYDMITVQTLVICAHV